MEIIDSDDYISPEEAVIRLHMKVCNKLKSLYGHESEDTLNNLMKWYIETLNEDIFEIEACHSFIRNMRKHIHFFHCCFKELTYISIDNYLDTMEDILALYLDFECEYFMKHPRKEQIPCKLLQILRIYLMYQKDRVFNVLLKIKLNLTSDRAKQFLDNLFKMALTPVPKNTTDIAFCRAYILHHRWKKVQPPGMYKMIDDLLYKHYSQTPNAINTNPVLKEVLQPQNDSLLDILAYIMDNDKILCKSYFKYIRTQKMQEDLIGDNGDVNNIDIDGRISPSYYNEDDIEGTTEDIETSLFGNINSSKTNNSVNEDVIEMEDSDDDCVIVGEGTVDCDSQEMEIVHEILGDDDDIESFVSTTSPDISIGEEPEMTTQPSEDNIELTNTVNDKSSLDSPITQKNTLENCSEHNPFSDIQIGTTYSVNFPSNDFIETVPLTDSSKDKQTLNDSIEENRFVNDPVEGSDILSKEVEDASLNSLLGDVTSVTEYPGAVNIFRSHSPLVISLQEKDTDNQFILNQLDSYIQENTSNESVDENVIADGSVLKEIDSSVQEESVEDNRVQIEEVNNSLVKENSVAGDTLNFITNNCVKGKSRVNGEHNRSEENEKNLLSMQLRVSVPRLDIVKSPEKKMNVIFTSKRNNINKLDNEVHLRYNELKGEHGLDDCLNGSLDKINCLSNIDNDFDLFDDNISIGEQEINMPLLNSSNTTTSPSSIVSPEFDEIEYFKNYLTSYQEENSKKALKNSSGSHLLDKAPRTNYPETPRPILKSDNNKNLLVPHAKRKRITFAEDDIILTPGIQEPIINHTSQIHGILKKSSLSPTLWIPKEHMNMQSLAHFRYRVKPTDYYLQSNPCVVIERLSEMEIKEWLRVTEKSRRKRLLKQKNSHSQARSSLAVSNMTMFRVDYDKQSPFVISTAVRYKAPEDQNWRCNARDPKLNPHDGGMKESGENDSFDIPTICKNKFCNNLLETFNKLNLNINVKSTIPKVSSNPFCVEIEQKQPAFIDLNLVNKIVENFGKCEEPVNTLDFINQPAAIPKVGEFEKTLQMEEVSKIPTIPSDLDNLNLRKFSPSPIMNCLSPHSPVHTYFSDWTNFNETPNTFQIKENEEERNVEEPKESAIIKIQTEELKVPDHEEELTFQDQKTACVITKELQTRLPLKKRKHSLANNAKGDSDEEAIGPEEMKEMLKQVLTEENDISYPATFAISIAEVLERLETQPRTFKTPAEKKEMPPPEYLSDDDDCLNGSLDKINCLSNIDNDFDLFDDNISIGEQEINMPLLNSSNTTTSPSSIVSPEFDEIEYFKNYLTSYQEENSKKALKNSSGSHLLDKAPRTNYPETPRPILKSDNNKNLLVPHAKRKRITFAEDDIILTPGIQEPIINHTSQIHGILKKSSLSPTLWIPKEHMNMQSLAHFRYRVKPTDYYLQSNPCVVIERLSEMEIKEWQRVTEKSRRKRLLKQKNSHSQARSSLAVSNMTMFRVDYDKQSPFVISTAVRYKAPEDQNWRCNARDPKLNPHDGGMKESGENDSFDIPTICKNKCCNNLLETFNKLNLNINVKSTIPKVSSNPFCVEIEQKQPAFIDLNLVNKIVENFGKCEEPVNTLDFINQPAAIPKVGEFEKTLQMEEVSKIPTIPSDLDNLNLRKFSPSPIMNCLSPHSPVHTYFSDWTNFNETPNTFQIKENEEERNVEEPKESAIIKIQTEELKVPDHEEELTFQDQKTACVITKELQTRLPLKKRKHSLANNAKGDSDEEAIGPEEMKEMLKQVLTEENDISYPATFAISIAEVLERLETQPRTFKTPAEKKEMPPPEYLSDDDDCLNGSLDKINCLSNIDNDFDLFDDNISIGEQEINMPLLNSSNTTTSPSSIVSPEFDKIECFKNYLTSYQEENSKKALKNSSGSHLLDKAPRTNYPETPRPILKSDNNKNLLVPHAKRKRITFAEDDIILTPGIQEPIINHTSQIHGILKKSSLSPTLWIPKEHMNMQSLAHFRYRVKPTDYYLQSNPCVVIERLSEMEIKEWQRVTEKSRRKRLLKQKNSHSQARSSLAVSNMTMFRVDYDKLSPFVISTAVRYKAPEDQNWRCNARDPKLNPHDGGMEESGENEYFHIPTICKNKCCNNLLETFNTLNLNINVKSTIPKVSSNPFCVEIEQKQPSFIDLNLVNKIVENFGKCEEPVNTLDFINQPAAIPKVGEFEKTLQMEEVSKIPTIPSDLDNLNLRKFSPSPIMNCLSPHSPVHTYFSDWTNFNETPNTFQIKENEEERNVEEPKESAIIKIQTEELKVPDHEEELTFQDQKTACVITKELQTRLPLKKRKHSLANNAKGDSDEEAIGPEEMKEMLKQVLTEENDISYPATFAISIAEVQERLETQPRTFKTPAEKKEMPPPEYLSVPKIITEQYNTHTYNKPTINYHMNNVPYTFFPCTNFSPILCTPRFDMNVVNAHQSSEVPQMSHPTEHEVRIKKEKRSRKRRRE